MTYRGMYESPLGSIALGSDGEALTGLWFVGQKYDGSACGGATVRDDLPVFDQARAWLDAYFAGDKPVDVLPLAPVGTPFRCAVWDELARIPYGEVVTYKQIGDAVARRLGRAVSYRAVGGAVGRNPLSIVVPCHRVVGSDGRLTGYAGGLERKKALLELEGIPVEGARVRLA